MTDKHIGSGLAALLQTLKPKAMQPASTKVLNTWIAQAEGKLGDEAKGGRLGWLIASSVAIAAVQRAIDTDGCQLFLLKGGTLLQHRLNATARTTKDVDGLIRGDMDAFLLTLEDVLDEPWGPLTLRRGDRRADQDYQTPTVRHHLGDARGDLASHPVRGLTRRGRDR